MRYLPCWKQIGISQDRYQELLHFCRQYPEWKMEANSLIGIRAIKADGLPHGKYLIQNSLPFSHFSYPIAAFLHDSSIPSLSISPFLILSERLPSRMKL